MALFTMVFIVAECDLPIMTASGTAVSAGLVLIFSDFCCICLHAECQFKMADPAGMFPPVNPVRKCGRFNPVFLGYPVDEDIPVLIRGRRRGKVPGLSRGIRLDVE